MYKRMANSSGRILCKAFRKLEGHTPAEGSGLAENTLEFMLWALRRAIP